MVYEILIATGLFIIAYILVKRLGTSIAEMFNPHIQININGHILKCDQCNSNATHVFNNRKRCDYHHRIAKQNNKNKKSMVDKIVS